MSGPGLRGKKILWGIRAWSMTDGHKQMTGREGKCRDLGVYEAF